MSNTIVAPTALEMNEAVMGVIRVGGGGKRSCRTVSNDVQAIRKKQDPEVNDASSSNFFIFLQLFHFFSLLVAPSSSSLLPPRPSFLLVPLSSSSSTVRITLNP